MFPRNVMLYGRTDDLPQTTTVQAGPLTAVFENGDLRYIRLGDREIIRRIYSAVRDHNWSTVLPVLSKLRIEQGAQTFHIQYDVVNRQDDIHFVWQGDISGAADGTIRFAMRGEAKSTFRRNRVGFCILHPTECAGAKARIEHVNGQIEEAVFPEMIAPQNIVEGIIKPLAPFDELRALSHEVLPGVWAELRMEGDIWELEDQRNWLDASYKTYCTPLRLTFPVEVPAGTRIEQTLTLTIRGARAAASMAEMDSSVRLTAAEAAGRLPKIGLDSASHGEALTADQIDRLKGLHLAHLRANIDMTRADWESRLHQAHDEAKAIGVLLEVALTLSSQAEVDAQAFGQRIAAMGLNLARIIVLRQGELATSPASVRIMRQAVPTVPLVSGTDANFCELNRERPTMPELAAAVDGLTYSITPQVHAFDNSSLVETLATVAATAETARAIGSNKPVSISPITFRMRFNPYATVAPKPTPPGQLPTQADVRQMSLFGAAWTLGCIAALTANRIDSATFYETTGWRGVMDTAAGSPVVEPRFYSEPGMTFPLYHVLADVGEFAGGEASRLASSDPLRAVGLWLSQAGRTRLLVANLTAQEQTISLPEMTSAGRIRLLDEATFEAAARDAAAFRQTGMALPAHNASLRLRPYAVACLDW